MPLQFIPLEVKTMKCQACDRKLTPAYEDCQLCKKCLAEVMAMKYEIPKPASFQEAVETLRVLKSRQRGEKHALE